MAIVAFWLSAATSQADEAPPFGFWLTENAKAIVRIQPCSDADKVCGRIVWLSEHLDAEGRVKTDLKNPDAARRDDPLCSVELIRAFERRDDGAWVGGKIYNPRDGNSYQAEMSLDDSGALKLHGYLLLPVFGSSQSWTRVEGDRGGCKDPGN